MIIFIYFSLKYVVLHLLSSVKIPFGMNVKLYDEPNFNGQQLNLYMNNRCLVDSGFNDKASSLAVNDFRT